MLIGRDDECATLARLVDGARNGVSSTVVLRGEAGCGKTRLCRYAAERSDGMVVLSGKGVESESHLPFAGLLQILRPVLDHIRQLPDVQRQALEGALGLGTPHAADPFAVYASTLTLLARASESGPVLVVVDDVQWMDRSSVAAVLFSARRLEHDRVVFVLAIRENDGEEPDFGGVPVIDIEGLTPAAAAGLLRHASPGPVGAAVSRRLVRATRGNPLAICELAGELSPEQLAGYEPIGDPLPVTAGIGRSFGRRIRALPPSLRTALLIVAAGADDVGIAETALGRLGGGAAGLGDDATDALVEVQNGRVSFRHPLMRAAAYHSASPTDRRAAHVALAEAFAAEPDRRAWHRAEAALGVDEDVADELDLAAERAIARSGLHESALTCERAARLSPGGARRAERLLRAALRYSQCGRSRHAAALCAEAMGGAADVRLQAEVARLRGRLDVWTSTPEQGYATLTRDVEDLAGAPPESRAALLCEAALPLIMTGQMGRAVQVARQAAALMVGRDDLLALMTRVTLAASLVLHGDSVEAAPLADRCVQRLRGAEAVDNHTWTLVAAPLTAYSLMLLEDLPGAESMLSGVIATARSRGAAGLLPMSLAHRAQVRLRTGAWALAEADAVEGVRLADETDQPSSRPYNLSMLARLAAARGQADRCREYADQAITVWGQNRPAIEFFVSSTIGLLHLGIGEPDAAVSAMSEILAVVEEGEIGEPWLVPWLPDLIEAQTRAGDLDAASGGLALLTEQAERTGRIAARAALARASGMLAGDDFESWFHEALRLHDQVPMPFERARTQLCFGERLRRARRKRESRSVLQEALAVFDRLGAGCWSDRTERELRAGGDRLPGRRRSPVETLTPQELQIASAVAAGATNREAAASLFLSPKTVENHLSRIYAKLGLRSRTDLANELSARS